MFKYKSVELKVLPHNIFVIICHTKNLRSRIVCSKKDFIHGVSEDSFGTELLVLIQGNYQNVSVSNVAKSQLW